MEKRNFTHNNHRYTVTLRDDADVSVFAEIFKLHEYRRVEAKIRSATSPIVDVGAHAGFFSLYARSLNSDVQIIALEPEPNNLKALEETLSTNALSNITIVPKALYHETGRANLIVAADNHNHFLERPFKGDGKKIRVATISLNDLAALYALEKIAVLKMDIEGGEYTVFENMQEADFTRIETIILEYHNTKSKNFGSIEKILREHGFSVEIFPSKFEKTMGFLSAINKKTARASS